MRVETINNATLMQVDCMEYMATLPDKAFQLAVCDPPYGLDADSMNGRGKMKGRAILMDTSWDKAPTQAYFDELRRVSVNQIIWGGNYFPLPPARCVIAWDKVQPWENFSQWEMAWTSFNSPAALFKFDNRTGDKIHPTQKPQALYEWLLTRFAKPCDRILDTHGGSMSSVIAALKMGFEITCTELDPDYFAAGVERVQNSQRQETLFTPSPPKQEQMKMEVV